MARHDHEEDSGRTSITSGASRQRTDSANGEIAREPFSNDNEESLGVRDGR